jgi:peptidoglycan endopeptidase LytF
MRFCLTLLASASLLVSSACIFGDSSKPGSTTPTAIPTATPFASVPPPVVVTPTNQPAASATPGGNTSEIVYTVVAGDSISVLADKFDVPSASIRALNNLTKDDLAIGQKVRIPAKATVNPGTSTTPPPPATNGVSTYTVKAGDSAFGIALQFDTTVEKLEAANGVKSGGLTSLQIGQVLKLPPPGQR